MDFIRVDNYIYRIKDLKLQFDFEYKVCKDGGLNISIVLARDINGYRTIRNKYKFTTYTSNIDDFINNISNLLEREENNMFEAFLYKFENKKIIKEDTIEWWLNKYIESENIYKKIQAHTDEYREHLMDLILDNNSE